MQQLHTVTHDAGTVLILAVILVNLITARRPGPGPRAPRRPAPGPARRFLCLRVDVQGYGRADDVRQAKIQRDLADLLDRAGERAGLDRRRWLRQPGGDEELALVPAEEPAARVVGDFCLELAAALWRHNQGERPAARLRLRLAIDDGPVDPARNGFAGRAVVGVSRLINAAPLRRALELAGGADLAVILADGVHRDWVLSGRSSVRRGWCRRVAVAEKEYAADAWLWLPGADAHALALPSSPPADRRGRASAGETAPAAA